MSDELLRRADQAVELTRQAGASGAMATVERERESSLGWRNGRLEKVGDSTRLSLTLAIIVDGRYSSSTTSDLRDEAIKPFVVEAVAMTRALARDPHRVLPDPVRYRDRTRDDLQLCDEGPEVTPAERQALCEQAEAAVRATVPRDRLVSVESGCSDELSESAKVVSNGMQGADRRTLYSCWASASVRDVGQRKPAGWWWANARRRGNLPAAASVGERAARRALGQLGARPLPTAKLPCVIENAAAGKLLQSLLEPLSGEAIQQKRSFLAGKIGQPVGGPLLQISNEPHLPGGLGSRAYDHEGMSTRRFPLFEAGVLRSYYLGVYYAHKLGLPPTTAGWSNLVYGPGRRDLDGLLGEMDEGLLITGFIGGNSNAATGDFSFGVIGHRVRGGKPAEPVAEMNLSGNHLSFWRQLLELGNDPFVSSSNRTPSLRLGPVQFSGV